MPVPSPGPGQELAPTPSRSLWTPCQLLGDGSDGCSDDAIFVAIDLEACFKSPGCGCVEPIEAAGGLQVPVGIEVPDVEEAGGVVAPEDLIDAGDGFSGQHLPLAAVAAGGADPPGGGDLLLRASAGLHEGQAIAAPEQLGVALGFQGGVGIADDAIFVAIDLEACFKSPGCGCVEPIEAAGGLQVMATAMSLLLSSVSACSPKESALNIK